MPAAFQPVVDALAHNPGISHGRMFGHGGLRVGRKFFALEWHGSLLIKLPADEVTRLVARKVGVRFDPGDGRPAKEWLVVAPGAADWVALAERALAYVGQLDP